MAQQAVNVLPKSRAAARSVVRCRIESSAAWLPWSQGALWQECHRSLQHAVAPWLEALQLPLRLRFEWHADRATDWPGETVCRLVFDERDFLFVRLPPPGTANVETVLAPLAAGLFAARASLMTPAVAQRLRHAAPAAIHDTGDHMLLACELLRRGLRPQRAWQAGRASPAATPRAYYDQIINQDDIALRIEVGDLSRLRHQPGDDMPLPKLLELMSDGLFYELGILLPPLEVVEDANLAPTAIRIWVNDMPLPLHTGLNTGEILVNTPPERLAGLGMPGARAAFNPANDNPCSILASASAENIAACAQAGLTTWGPAGYQILVLATAVRRHAGALWSIDATAAALFLLRDYFEPLIQAIEQKFDHVLLTQVLRGLLDEALSVRDLYTIFESMLAIDAVSNLYQRQQIVFAPRAGHMALSHRATTPKELQAEDWIACLRTRLARALSYQYTQGQSTLFVYLLDPDIEAQIEAASRRSPATTGAAHALDSPQSYLLLFGAIDAAIKNRVQDTKPVILTTQSARYTLRELIAKDFPDIAVLCYEELNPDMAVQPIASIGLK